MKGCDSCEGSDTCEGGVVHVFIFYRYIKRERSVKSSQKRSDYYNAYSYIYTPGINEVQPGWCQHLHA